MNRMFVVFKALAIVLPLLFSNQSFAGHAANFEMHYRWVSDSTYQFTVIFYRSCQGFTAPAPNSITLRATSSTGSFNTFTLGRLSTTGPNVPTLIPQNLMNCTDNTFCIEEYVFRGNWTSPFRDSSWVFDYSLCCISGNNPPVNVSSSAAFYNECSLNNYHFPDTLNKNIAPYFHTRRPNIPTYPNDTIINYPLAAVCESREVELDLSAREYNGDKVKYELIRPLTTNGTPITYNAGYSFSNPMPTDTNGIQIDSATGLITFKAGTPTSSGVYMIGIKATEYRNDTTFSGTSYTVQERIIGHVNRHLVITIEDSATCQDLDFSFSDSTALDTEVDEIDITCDNNPIEIGFTISIKCNTIASDGSDILLVDTTTLDTINVNMTEPTGCVNNNVSRGMRIHLDSALSTGVYRLMLVQGSDGNTFSTECDRELDVFGDTLYLDVVEAPPTGVIIGDTIIGDRDTVYLECNSDEFEITLTEQVFCSSVESGGSDFLLLDHSMNPPVQVPLLSASPNCSAKLTTKIDIVTANPLPAGNYSLHLIVGSDGNRLINTCFLVWDSSAVNIKVEDVDFELGPDFTYCNEDPFDTTLNAGSQYAGYLWNNGSLGNVISIDTAGTYWVEVTTLKGCKARDTVVVTGIDCYAGLNQYDHEVLKIYPNPGRDFINIESPSSIVNGRILVYTADGKEMDQIRLANSGTSRLDLSSYSPGIYIIRLLDGEQVIAEERLVVEKE